MMLYRPDNTDIDRGENRPDNTDIDRGEASVNIGIIRLISHHVQCLNRQQLLYYIISQIIKKELNNLLDHGQCCSQLEFLLSLRTFSQNQPSVVF